MWEYHQSDGQLFHDGQYVAEGYSGHGEGRNNPSFQRVRAVGPIPQGKWRIVGPPRDTESHGPYVLGLEPDGADTFGRSAFLVHGDSKFAPGTASKGCIILPRAARETVWNSGDRELNVIA